MSKAIKKFWLLRDSGMSENEAAAECWSSYKSVHVVDYKKWSSTSGNPGSRRGVKPLPFKMTQKTGPAPKMSNYEKKFAKSVLDRNPKMNNEGIAKRVEENSKKRRLSGAESTPRRKRRISSKDISRLFNTGLNRSPKNVSDNFRGYPFSSQKSKVPNIVLLSLGLRKVTYKGAEKRPKNWIPQHRHAFISGLRKIFKNDQKFLQSIGWEYPNADFKPSNTIHIDTSKINSKVWHVSAARAPVGNTPILKNCEEKRIPGGSAFNGIWPGDSNSNPGFYSALELDHPRCNRLNLIFTKFKT